MSINTEAKLEALEVFDEIAEAVERGLTIEEGAGAAGLPYHWFYCLALQMKDLGKVKLIRSGETIRLVASAAPCPKEAEVFTSAANTAAPLRAFLLRVQAGIQDGTVPVDQAEMIASIAAAQINQSLFAEVG